MSDSDDELPIEVTIGAGGRCSDITTGIIESVASYEGKSSHDMDPLEYHIDTDVFDSLFHGDEGADTYRELTFVYGDYRVTITRDDGITVVIAAHPAD